MDPLRFYRQKLDEQLDECVESTRLKLAELLGRPDIRSIEDPQEYARAIMDEMDRKRSDSDDGAKRVLRHHGVDFRLADAFRHVRNDVMHRSGEFTRDEPSFQKGLEIIRSLRTGITQSYDVYQVRTKPKDQDSPERTRNRPRDTSGRTGTDHRAPPGRTGADHRAPPGRTGADHRASAKQPGATARPAARTSQRRRNIVRLAYFAALMSVACVLGILAGAVAVFIGFSENFAFFVWLCICALAADLIIEKLGWRGKLAISLKYVGKVTFWFILGVVVSGGLSELPTPLPDNLLLVPMLLIWALGAFLILKRMITAGRRAIQ